MYRVFSKQTLKTTSVTSSDIEYICNIYIHFTTMTVCLVFYYFFFLSVCKQLFDQTPCSDYRV